MELVLCRKHCTSTYCVLSVWISTILCENSKKGSFKKSTQVYTRLVLVTKMKILVKVSILTLATLGVHAANAAIIPVLNSGSPTPSGSNFAFNYTANLQQDERLDPAATSGVTCPGPSNSTTNVQCQPPGTFFTIYDVPDFVGASAPSGWMMSHQLLGLTPSSVNGSSIDLPTVVNVTFMYIGPVLHANGVVVPISGFQIISKDNLTVPGFYSFQATKDSGDSAGNTDQGAGPTTVPSITGEIQTVPETGSLLLLGCGLIALGICRHFVPVSSGIRLTFDEETAHRNVAVSNSPDCTVGRNAPQWIGQNGTRDLYRF